LFQRIDPRDDTGVKREFFLLLLFAGIVLPLCADDDATVWSPAQRGLQARLFISQPQTADYTFAVSIEFRNVLEDSSAVGQMLKVNFSRDDLVCTVRDSSGNIVKPSSPSALDEMVAIWSLTLPPWARMSFPIGRGGGTPPSGLGTGKLLSFGGFQQWVLAPEGGPYRLSATLYSDSRQALRAQIESSGLKPAIPPNLDQPGRPPRELRGGWDGTLDLPPIDLPRN
jgi:hypothetical protein